MIVVGLVVFPLLLHVDRTTRTALVVAAVLFVGGAIGMELVAEPSALASEWTGALYTVLMTIEEVLEMTALLLVIATLHSRLTRGGRMQLLVPSSP